MRCLRIEKQAMQNGETDSRCLRRDPTYVWVAEVKILRLQGWATHFCHASAFQLLCFHPEIQAQLRSELTAMQQELCRRLMVQSVQRYQSEPQAV